MDIDRLLLWMEPWIDASFASPAFDPIIAAEVLNATAGRSLDAHTRLLQRWNGFYALDGLVHVFGACELPPNHSLRAWNASDGWRRHWGPSLEGLTFFAEDAFGDQFAYRAGGKIVRLGALAATIEAMEASITEWIEEVLLDPDRALNRRLFEACVRMHGTLAPGGHFAPSIALPPGTPLEPDIVMILPSRDDMERKAVVAPLITRKATQSIRAQRM